MTRDKSTYNPEGLTRNRDIECTICGSIFQGKGRAKYCSTACRSKNEYEANMMKYEWRLNKLVAMAKNRASSKSVGFNIDTSHMIELWDENLGCCALSGIPFELGRSKKGKVHPYSPSIDRIVPSDGYVKGNVRLVCYQMNVALSEFGIEQFDELIANYLQYKG